MKASSGSWSRSSRNIKLHMISALSKHSIIIQGCPQWGVFGNALPGPHWVHFIYCLEQGVLWKTHVSVGYEVLIYRF